MGRKQQDDQQGSNPAAKTSKDDAASPAKGNTTANGGYPEKHGPRYDADGWGEANAARSDRAGTSESSSQGKAAGERSFGNGQDDRASEAAASDAALREPGERGAADAEPANPETKQEESPQDEGFDGTEQALSTDGRQIDYGQGGGQGYVHTGKPGAPGPDGKPD